MMNFNTQHKSIQTTDTVLMVVPAAFGYNEETAVNNSFQSRTFGGDIAETAIKETEAYIRLLKDNGITVLVAYDTPEPRTPDAVFPNNWFSTHEDGILVMYPMFAENRRLERKQWPLEEITANFDISRMVDLRPYEEKGMFLEGTGSLVLDRVNRIAYACKSPRTNMTVLDDFCSQLGYTPCVFEAYDEDGMQIYHTNVMMNVGTRIAVVCMDSIKDPGQRELVRETLEKTGKVIMEITPDQMNHFAGNMLELHNRCGKPCLVMSQTAYNSLTAGQISMLETHMKLITPDIPCIEQIGGGSARCMLAEIF